MPYPNSTEILYYLFSPYFSAKLSLPQFLIENEMGTVLLIQLEIVITSVQRLTYQADS